MMPTAKPSVPPPDRDASPAQRAAGYWADVQRRLAPYFARTEPRRRAMAYLQGLLSAAERKNSWQLAEVSGDVTPYGFQHLLRRADWNPDAVRDELRTYVIQRLGTRDAVLMIDEIEFPKKGQHSAGVARQYCRTAGRIENCQIGVFLTYASPAGQALLDRELYLPEAWANDPSRRRRAGIPPDRRFMTKPQLAQQMLHRAFAADIPVAWVTGAIISGDERRLRTWLESTPQGYVLEVSGQVYLRLGGQQRQVKTIVAALPARDWTRLPGSDGGIGSHAYEWRWVPLGEPMPPAWRRWLLVRRRAGVPTDAATYMVFAPQATTLADVVAVVGRHEEIQRRGGAAKGEVGMDHYEVRSWTGWYRHITLAMWAYALLTVLRADATPGQILHTSPAQPPGTSSLSVFKARRGLKTL